MIPSSAIPFEEFMRRALYDPRRGYYARRITGIGRHGDFTTAPQLSDAPARAIASWARNALREGSCRDLIEIGPGTGKLAAAVLKRMPWHVRRKTRLHLVETSAPLAKLQQDQLGNKALWHKSPSAALATCGGNAVIYSNELVDAFPVRRFKNTEHGWCEIAVSADLRGIARESLLPPAPLPESSAFSGDHPPGQSVEVHESYHQWLAGWLPHWKSGRMLTIDYGSTADSLYHRRPAGTLRAYLLQQRIEGLGIYQNAGRQDLTADANFTDLMEWSSPWVAQQTLQGLARFLENTPGPHPAGLVDPDGAGTAFLVLDQKR